MRGELFPMRSFTCSLLALVAMVAESAACGGVTSSAPAGDDAGSLPPPVTEGGVPGSVCGRPFPVDIPVAGRDAFGYPPYATDGCSLVYVRGVDAPGTGELRLRNLSDGTESTLAPSSEKPSRPSIAGTTIAWEAMQGTSSIVRATEAGEAIAVAGSFDHAGEPRVAAGIVVFTGWKTSDPLGDTDVFALDTKSGKIEVIAAGPGQQRFTDVSDAFIAITDFAEDADGTFNDNPSIHDLADIVIYDRAARTLTTRKRPGKQAFPVLASGTHLGWLDWGGISPMPKLTEFNLRSGAIVGPNAEDVFVELIHASGYIRPAARNGMLQWVTRSEATLVTSLRHAPADGSSAPSSFTGLDGLDLADPSASATLTVVATRASGGGPQLLRGLAR